nr:MAG TPA: hypothetical protein [Caudoviricetes sp.]DAV82733.1 MAG TPA: hypothetical protein [Caudoviricetes sp.]
MNSRAIDQMVADQMRAANLASAVYCTSSRRKIHEAAQDKVIADLRRRVAALEDHISKLGEVLIDIDTNLDVIINGKP